MKNNRVLALFLFLLTLMSTILVGGTLPYFIFYILILAISIPLIQSLISIRSLEARIIVPEASLYSDDKIDLNYKISNTGFFSIPYLEIEDEISKKLTKKDPKKTIISLEKAESYRENKTIYLNRRGYYELVSIKVRVRDVFGLYSFNKTLSSSSSLLVYPRPIEINNFKIISSQVSGELLVDESTSKDKTSIESFRNYVSGDSIKSIHWKLSGKFDQLIIKEYENSGDTNTLLLVDNSKENFSNDLDRRTEDKSVDIALSIIDYCLRENIPTTLKTQREDSPMTLQGQEEGDLKSFLELLAKLQADGTYSFKSFVDSQVEKSRKDTTLILISNSLDREIASRILDIKMKGLNIISIFVTDIENSFRRIDVDLEVRLHQEGIPLYIIDYKDSVKNILEGYHE